MKKKLFGNQIEPNCEYCSHSSHIDDTITCSLGHTIDTGSKCRYFLYDPLLRSPKCAPPLREYDENDFKL